MTDKCYIRKARQDDLCRIAEILVFNKRLFYRQFFNDDVVSFNEIQVVPTMKRYEKLLDKTFVYDDGIVKGMMYIEGTELVELYVDSFFQGQNIGSILIDYGIERGINKLWVIENNKVAIDFYLRHGFRPSGLLINESETVFSIQMVK